MSTEPLNAEILDPDLRPSGPRDWLSDEETQEWLHAEFLRIHRVRDLPILASLYPDHRGHWCMTRPIIDLRVIHDCGCGACLAEAPTFPIPIEYLDRQQESQARAELRRQIRQILGAEPDGLLDKGIRAGTESELRAFLQQLQTRLGHSAAS